MIPSWKKLEELLKTIEKGKYKENPKNLSKHEKYKTLASMTFEKATNPKYSWSQSFRILKDTWGHCFNSLKFHPNAPDVWELFGDTSYERCEMVLALFEYDKALEQHPENEEKIRLKRAETAKIANLFIALESEQLPINVQFHLLICIGCGADGKLNPYVDIKRYTVNTGAMKYKMTATTTVPLCDNCNTSPKSNARRNLKYGSNGVAVKVGKGKPLAFSLWKQYVILEKFKAGLIDDEIFSALPQNLKT